MLVRPALALLVTGLLAVAAMAQGPKSGDAGGSSSATSTAAIAGTPKPVVSKPLWRDLNVRQQRALEPLIAVWDGLTEPHKRKWLALSKNYAQLSPEEQKTAHSRMAEWASLSNQQRAQARLNFAEVKQVPVDERKAKWEAYQALSDQEKGKLAARAVVAKPPGAAPTIRPVPAQKLAPAPVWIQEGHTPRIQIAPALAGAPGPVQTSTTVPSLAPLRSAPAPEVHSGPPVSAEAQVPPPSPAAPAPRDLSISAVPPVRTTDQPSSAP